MQLDAMHTVGQLLGNQVIVSPGLRSQHPVRQRRQQRTGHRIGREPPGVLRLGGERADPAESGLPDRGNRRLEFIAGDQEDFGPLPAVTEIVAAETGGAAEVGLRDRTQRRRVIGLDRRVDEGIAGHQERILRENARKLVGAVRKIDHAVAAARHILQETGVAVLPGAEPDHADRDPGPARALQQLPVSAGLLRIGGVGEEDQVAGRRIRPHQLVRRLVERRISEDASAHRLDAADAGFAADDILARRQRNDRMRSAVDRDDSEFVARHHQPVDLERGQIRHIHLGQVPDRRRHAAGAIQRDDESEQIFAELLPLLHRDRQYFLERRTVVAADGERTAAAGHHQPERAGSDHAGQQRHAVRPEPRSRDVFKDHSGISGQLPRRQFRRGRAPDDDWNLRLREHPRKVAGGRLRQQQHRLAPRDRDQPPRPVVPGPFVRRRVGADNLDRIIRHAGLIAPVAPGNEVDAAVQLHLAHHPAAVAAPDAAGHLLRLRGDDPAVQCVELPGRGRHRRVDSGDGQIVRRSAEKPAQVDRNAARGGSGKCASRVHAGPAPVRDQQDAPRRISRNLAQRKRKRPRHIRSVRIRNPAFEAVETGGLRQLVDDRFRAESDHAQTGVARTRSLEAAEKRLSLLFRVIRHRTAAVDRDDQRSGPVGPLDDNARKRQHERKIERQPEPGDPAAPERMPVQKRRQRQNQQPRGRPHKTHAPPRFTPSLY